MGCSIAGSRSSIRSASTERARARSWPRLRPAHSRPASATSSVGSCAESRSAPKIWWRAVRLPGSIVGPTSTIGPTRCGRRTASSVTTWQPIELATNAGRSSLTASSQARAHRRGHRSRVVARPAARFVRDPGGRARIPSSGWRGSAPAAACGPRHRTRARARPAAPAPQRAYAPERRPPRPSGFPGCVRLERACSLLPRFSPSCRVLVAR